MANQNNAVNNLDESETIKLKTNNSLDDYSWLVNELPRCHRKLCGY